VKRLCARYPAQANILTMKPVRLPDNLVWVDGAFPDAGRRAWIAELPATIGALAERWGLDVGQPYQPGGQCSWTAPVRDAHGRDLVLKVGWAHVDSASEADGLRFWAGDGTVLLHDAHDTGTTQALLLERAVPGTRANCLPEPDQDVVVAGLLKRLWRPAPAGVFRSLGTMCGEWAAEFAEKLAAGQTHGLDAGLVREGLAIYDELGRSTRGAVLLCTDLHAENIVAARREPWLVIDPKPHVGDPHYDPVQHMLNCRERLHEDPFGLSDRMADLLDLDRARLRLHVFARMVIESIDIPWVRPVAVRTRPR